MTRRYVAPALSLPQVSDTSAVRKWMEKVNNLLTVREGMLGDSLDQNVTFRDLFESGLTKEYIDGVYQAWGGNNSTGTIPSTADGPANYDIPPAPTGLVVASGIGVNILQWTNPATLYGNHSYTEVWRSATNNLGVAVKISTWPFYLAEDTLGTTNSTYHYWIRFVSKASKPGPYNAGATSGVVGTTAYVVASNIFVTNLAAINVDTGNLTAGTLTGLTIRTSATAGDGSASGFGLVMNSAALKGYKASSTTPTFILDASNGDFSFGQTTTTKYVKFTASTGDVELGRDTKLLGTSAYNNTNIFWEWGGDSIDSWGNTTAVGGTVTVSDSSINYAVTASNGSFARTHKGYSLSRASWGKNRRLKFYFKISQTPGASQIINIGMGRSSGGAFDQIVFRLAASLSLDATCGTAASSTTAGLTTTLVVDTTYLLEIVYLTGVSATFYVDTVLKGTITTNLPTGSVNAERVYDFNMENSGASSITNCVVHGLAFLQDP